LAWVTIGFARAVRLQPRSMNSDVPMFSVLDQGDHSRPGVAAAMTEAWHEADGLWQRTVDAARPKVSLNYRAGSRLAATPDGSGGLPSLLLFKRNCRRLSRRRQDDARLAPLRAPLRRVAIIEQARREEGAADVRPFAAADRAIGEQAAVLLGNREAFFVAA